MTTELQAHHLSGRLLCLQPGVAKHGVVVSPLDVIMTLRCWCNSRQPHVFTNTFPPDVLFASSKDPVVASKKRACENLKDPIEISDWKWACENVRFSFCAFFSGSYLLTVIVTSLHPPSQSFIIPSYDHTGLWLIPWFMVNSGPSELVKNSW